MGGEYGEPKSEAERWFEEVVEKELLVIQLRRWVEFYDRNIKPLDRTGRLD